MMKYRFEDPWQNIKRSNQIELIDPRTQEALTANIVRPIPHGSEGYKAIVEINTPQGSKRYFLKEFKSTSEAEDQLKKYSSLKSEGVNVPEEATLFTKNDGGAVILFSDLSHRETYTVLSSNDPHLEDRSLMHICHVKIPFDVRVKLQAQLIKAAEKGAAVKPRPLDLWSNPYGLVVDRQNPSDANFYVMDFGWDIDFRDASEAEVLRSNIFRAGQVYSSIVGEALVLPDNHPLAKEMNQELADSAQRMIKVRGFEAIEGLFKILE